MESLHSTITSEEMGPTIPEPEVLRDDADPALYPRSRLTIHATQTLLEVTKIRIVLPTSIVK